MAATAKTIATVKKPFRFIGTEGVEMEALPGMVVNVIDPNVMRKLIRDKSVARGIQSGAGDEPAIS